MMFLTRSFNGRCVAVTTVEGTTFTGVLAGVDRRTIRLTEAKVTGGPGIPGLLVIERAHVLCWQVVTDA